jgi:cell division inhibitor SepF
MGVRDRLDRIAAWFGFGVDDEDYYEDEVEEDRRYGSEEYVNSAGGVEVSAEERKRIAERAFFNQL